jgi:hypothetical protein
MNNNPGNAVANIQAIVASGGQSNNDPMQSLLGALSGL